MPQAGAAIAALADADSYAPLPPRIITTPAIKQRYAETIHASAMRAAEWEELDEGLVRKRIDGSMWRKEWDARKDEYTLIPIEVAGPSLTPPDDWEAPEYDPEDYEEHDDLDEDGRLGLVAADGVLKSVFPANPHTGSGVFHVPVKTQHWSPQGGGYATVQLGPMQYAPTYDKYTIPIVGHPDVEDGHIYVTGAVLKQAAVRGDRGQGIAKAIQREFEHYCKTAPLRSPPAPPPNAGTYFDPTSRYQIIPYTPGIGHAKLSGVVP